MKRPKIFVVALGGNSIIKRSNSSISLKEQYSNLRETCGQLIELAEGDTRLVITHGNGPQVGNLLLANELARDVVPSMTLDICGAATQGFMGYMIQQTLANRLRQAGLKHNITTIVTQVIVDSNAPDFEKPTKPIGPFYTLSEAERLRRDRGWEMIEDSARGYRRVVPSPKPIQIQEVRIIQHMLENDEIVIAVGGGGIPVVRQEDRSLRGIEAVIDKDYASSRLAIDIEADTIIFLTAVEKVFRNFGSPHQEPLDHLTVAQAKQLLGEGQFGIGSMEPKIGAAINFLEFAAESHQEREAIITLPETLHDALRGKTGTRITKS